MISEELKNKIRETSKIGFAKSTYDSLNETETETSSLISKIRKIIHL